MRLMQYEIFASKKFDKELARTLGKNTVLKKKVIKTLHLLGQNIDHPSLRLHKLTNSEKYSISVNMSIRILFEISQNTIILLGIGKHEEVY